MWTDEQFERFLQTIIQKSTDHDLLIEIKSNLSNHIINIQRQREDDAEKRGVQDKAILAAHKRIDDIQSATNEKFEKNDNRINQILMIIGVGVLGAIVTAVIKLAFHL